MGRDLDLAALDKRNTLRDANLPLIKEAKAMEKIDLEKAVTKYIKAIDSIKSYASIIFDKGLVGQLLKEEASDLGIHGEIRALDRLTICLVKLGESSKAYEQSEKYFSLYRRDLEFSCAKKILKRVNKAITRK